MRKAVEELRIELGRMAMRRPGKLLREAYVACRFAEMKTAQSVRLLPERHRQPTPDFAIALDEAEFWFEITEIDRPGRRRGDEARRKPDEVVVEDSNSHWVNSSDYANIVAQRVSAKSTKAYDKCDGLVIWSNAPFIIEWEDLTLEWWRTAAEAAEATFPETWVHYDECFRQLF